jgi:hypothetical protein
MWRIVARSRTFVTKGSLENQLNHYRGNNCNLAGDLRIHSDLRCVEMAMESNMNTYNKACFINTRVFS